MAFKPGQKVKIARSTYSCGSCRGNHGRYLYGTEISAVPLELKTIVESLDSPERVLVRTPTRGLVAMHPDELELLLSESGILDGIKQLPKHPIFEIAENGTVVLMNGKVYSADGAAVKGKGDIFEDRDKEKKLSLVEVGDFKSLDALALDRAQPEIEKIQEDYAIRVGKELDSLKSLDGNLDVPQLIAKQVFPYLRDGAYTGKVSELLGVESREAPEGAVVAKRRSKQDLEKIVLKVEQEVSALINELEAKPEPPKRTGRESKLDALLDYTEPETPAEPSLFETALKGRKLAIIKGVVYEMVKGGRSDKTVKIDGEKYSLIEKPVVEKIVKEPKTGFEVGDRIVMNAEADGHYSHSRQGSEGVIVKRDGSREYEVRFTRLTGGGASTPQTYDGIFSETMTNLEKIEVKTVEDAMKGLEQNFMEELDKRIKIEALRKQFTKEKISDVVANMDAELLEFAGKTEHKDNGFGFVNREGRYFVYVDVPKFIIKSQFDNNYYLFDESRVGIQVEKNGRAGLRYFGGNIDSSLFMLDNIRHPLTSDNRAFQHVCIGENVLPTSGEDIGEVIAKRLAKGRDIALHGYTYGGKWFRHRTLGVCGECGDEHYKDKIISEKKALESGLLIADGRRSR